MKYTDHSCKPNATGNAVYDPQEQGFYPAKVEIQQAQIWIVLWQPNLAVKITTLKRIYSIENGDAALD